MRECHLNAYRAGQPKALVTGINSVTPISTLRETQGDTLTVFVHSYQRNTAQPPLTTFVEEPLIADSVRASVGYIDAAPQSGSFRLKVGDQTTAELEWPEDTSTPALLSAWKEEVLAALNELSTVDGDARLDDPKGTPAHFFYFTWLTSARTDEIEVVSNRLLPWCEVTVVGSVTPVGYTQLVKLTRFPVVMSGAFAQATTPPAVIFQSRSGAAGTNAEQTLVIPVGAIGSFSLKWAGASTRTMAVGTVTEASLADALNAIVTAGTDNPSFRVERRAIREGLRFAIELIGPLAGAAQPMLEVAMHDQEGAPWWVGTLVLDGLGIELALNGAETTTLKFELVISDEGEETYLLPIVIENDMTNEGTLPAAEQAGAIAVVEKIIYVDAGLGEPMILAAPGFEYRPTAAGNTLVITHNLDTWEPAVQVTLYAVDQALYAAALLANPGNVAAALASPGVITGSRKIEVGEYRQAAQTSKNQVQIKLPWNLVDDVSSPYDFRLLKVAVSKPAGTLQAWSFKVLWANVLESLPDGQSLVTKLAALEAQITSLIGGLKIQPSALDLVALVPALLALIKSDATFRAQFVDLVKTVVSSDDIMRVIATELRDHAEFIESIKKAFEDTSLISTLIAELKESTEFLTEIRSLILEALQRGAQLPPGLIPLALPDFHFAFPPPQEIPGGSTETEVGKIQITKTTGGTETISTEPQIVRVSEKLPRFQGLPVALESDAPTAIGGEIGLSDVADGTVRLVDGSLRVRTIGRRRGQTYPDGALIARKNETIFPVYTDPGDEIYFWPAEMESDMWTLTLQESQMPEGSRFELSWLQQAQLLGGYVGRIDLVVLAGVIDSNWGMLGNVELSEHYSRAIGLDSARGFYSCVLRVDHTDSGERVGYFNFAGQEGEFGMDGFPLKLVVGFRRFDAEDVLAGKSVQGCLLLDVVKPVASITSL